MAIYDNWVPLGNGIFLDPATRNFYDQTGAKFANQADAYAARGNTPAGALRGSSGSFTPSTPVGTVGPTGLTGGPITTESEPMQQSLGPFNFSTMGLPVPASAGGGLSGQTNPLGSTSAPGPDIATMLAMLAGTPQIQPAASPGAVTYPFISTGPEGVTPTQAAGISSMYGPLPSSTPIRTPSPAEANREQLQAVTTPMQPQIPEGLGHTIGPGAQPLPPGTIGMPRGGGGAGFVGTTPFTPPQPPDANTSPTGPTDANTGQPIDLNSLIANAAAGLGMLPAGGPAPSGSFPSVGGGQPYQSTFGLPIPRQRSERGRSPGR